MCKEAYEPPKEALHRLGLQPGEGEDVIFYHGGGCSRCKGTGYKGRTGLYELMVMSDSIREFVLRGAAAPEIRTQAINGGMRTLRDDGILKVLLGHVSAEGQSGMPRKEIRKAWEDWE